MVRVLVTGSYEKNKAGESSPAWPINNLTH